MRPASRRSCVTTTRLVPRSRFSSSISANTLSALAPSRLPVGSSASTMRGCVTSARATAARWRSPPESWCGPVLEALAETHPLEERCAPAARVAALASAARAAASPHSRGQRTPAAGGETGRRSRAPGCAAAPRSCSLSCMDVAPRDHHLPGARAVQPPQYLQQRRLAGARGADDRHALAGRDREIARPASTFEHLRSLAEALVRPRRPSRTAVIHAAGPPRARCGRRATPGRSSPGRTRRRPRAHICSTSVRSTYAGRSLM